MDLLVSCTLKGRDLAVVKSIININNIYGDLNLTYVKDVQLSQVLFAKKSYQGEEVYYAEDRTTRKQYKIKPNLNPKTVRAMFEFLGNSMKVSSLENNTDIAETTSIHQFILRQSKKVNNQLILLTHPDFSLVIDHQKQQAYSNVELTDERIKSIANKNFSDFKFEYIDEKNNQNFSFEMSLSTFKWNLGYFQENKLVINEYKENKKIFKLLSWPNFGRFKFDQEFIKICSLLNRNPTNYEHLINLTGYQESTINKFLNATMMAGFINVELAERTVHVTSNRKNTHFLQSLKKFFGFS